MANESGPFFANVVEMVNMYGGNAHLVNGYYVPTEEFIFSFPIYAKYCVHDRTLTSTKLSLFKQGRRYFWVVRDGDDRIIARLKYSSPTRTTLCLPEHIPPGLTWELLSTGFLGLFKKKQHAYIKTCSDNELLQQMSPHLGPEHLASMAESIRFIDTTVQDMETLLERPSIGGGNRNGENNALMNLGNMLDDMSMDEIIELFSGQIQDGNGTVFGDHSNAHDNASFASVQEQVEKRVATSLSSAKELEKVLAILSDEAPDEFLDPIMLTIMRNPMKVPTSPHVFDRSTLVEHLANSPSDPFSRKYLTMDMIYPDVALQIKIENWLISRGASLP